MYPSALTIGHAMPRRRRGGRRGGRTLRYEEVFTFSVNNGATTSVQVGTLGNRPPRSNFRPVWFEVEAREPWVPATATLPGYYAPGSIQITLNGPRETGDSVAVSNLCLLGSTPRRVRVHYPPSADWWPWNNVSSDVVATIDAVCVGTTSPGTAFVRGIGRIMVQVSVEDIATPCPSVHLESTGSAPGAPLIVRHENQP